MIPGASVNRVIAMPEIIACPSCQRRLHLPEGFEGELVQGPSGQSQLPAAEARARGIPGTSISSLVGGKFIPTLEHYVASEDADDPGRDYPGSRRLGRSDRPRSAAVKRPSWMPWVIGGMALCVVATVFGLGV